MATTITAASVCIFYKGNQKVTFGALIDGGLGAICLDLASCHPGLHPQDS